MSGLTDILMIGLLAVGGYYLLSSGALGTAMGTPTPTTTPVTYTEPAPAPAPAVLPTLDSQCTTEGGKWQGNCCSCPDKECFNKCGETNFSFVEACDDEDGIWQVNAQPPCCSCPNKDCSWKCGKLKGDPSGGVPGGISKEKMLEGVCLSSGDDNKWNWSTHCCECESKTCRNSCKSAPSKLSSKGSGKAQPSSPPKKAAPKGSVTLKKPPAKPGITAAKPSKVKQCAAFTGATKTACLNSYAHAYLAGSSNRRGPSYTGRDDYRHLTNVEFPSHVDFEYEAMNRPYYLGPQSRERHELLNRFQSNFATMRFSG